MNGELLAILDQIEREKGIDKEVLIQAVEAALLSAARKVIDVKPNEELKVQLDRNTGKIKAIKGTAEIASMDFGRIAAQTAKQVIIQKIREAEKEVVFIEFQSKIGEIVSGTVYRFEKGNIIVDLLGRAEGLLPRREQSSAEEFKQGQRIRTYCLGVKKEAKGAQIILSRAHPNFVKELFELEVPEIYEGIVEIRSISRAPGERTKIAVYSKNDKVDSVGACVGMRGSRVKNVVSELQGEKIDIVRWSEDIREYIQTALAPAKISEIRLDKDNQKAEVIVDPDQLSLAIGKHGQNVRLASHLLGWDLDIRTKETAAVAKPKKEEPEMKISGVGKKTEALLKEAGFTTLEAVAKANIEDLLKVKGIGEKKAQKLIEEAKKIIKNSEES
jgi:N utilization substance protein A